MKKLILLLVVILVFSTGCTVVRIDHLDVGETIDTILNSSSKLYNKSFQGYSIYLPKGISISKKSDYNIRLNHEKQDYYLYVDAIAYFHKTELDYEKKEDLYFSRELEFDQKKGYIEIYKTNDKYFIEAMFNYAKMEAYVSEDNFQESIMYIFTILNSLNFEDKVLESLIGENVLDYKEEKFDIFKPKDKTDESNFLDYIKEYDVYYDKDKELPNEDEIRPDDSE